MINLEPDPDDLQGVFIPDPLLINHYEGIIEKQAGKIRELECVIETLKIDVNDTPY